MKIVIEVDDYFKDSTMKLLTAIKTEYAQTNNRRVKLSLKDYINSLGLKDIEEAREKIKQDLNALFFAEISYYRKMRKKPSYHSRIITAHNNAKNDIIEVEFNEDYLDFAEGVEEVIIRKVGRLKYKGIELHITKSEEGNIDTRTGD